MGLPTLLRLVESNENGFSNLILANSALLVLVFIWVTLRVFDPEMDICFVYLISAITAVPFILTKTYGALVLLAFVLLAYSISKFTSGNYSIFLVIAIQAIGITISTSNMLGFLELEGSLAGFLKFFFCLSAVISSLALVLRLLIKRKEIRTSFPSFFFVAAHWFGVSLAIIIFIISMNSSDYDRKPVSIPAFSVLSIIYLTLIEELISLSVNFKRANDEDTSAWIKLSTAPLRFATIVLAASSAFQFREIISSIFILFGFWSGILIISIAPVEEEGSITYTEIF